MYIQVDFSNKSDRHDKDTNRRPQIHGEENRTEYTFVDFSKKAPPIQQDDEEQGHFFKLYWKLYIKLLNAQVLWRIKYSIMY